MHHVTCQGRRAGTCTCTVFPVYKLMAGDPLVHYTSASTRPSGQVRFIVQIIRPRDTNTLVAACTDVFILFVCDATLTPSVIRNEKRYVAFFSSKAYVSRFLLYDMRTIGSY